MLNGDVGVMKLCDAILTDSSGSSEGEDRDFGEHCVSEVSTCPRDVLRGRVNEVERGTWWYQ